MIFTETPLAGSFVVDLEKRTDERGFFARQFCRREFEQHGLVPDVLQVNTSFSRHRGTLRGMHFQKAPHGETKFIRCTRGKIYDVIVDLRPDSPTSRGWFGTELSPENGRMLYVPRDFAHGFLTLEDDSEVIYLVSAYYTPAAEAGLRYDDPAFGIAWPEPVRVISGKDNQWEDFRHDYCGSSARTS